MLLAVDECDVGATLEETEVAAAYGVAVRSIESLRKQFVEEDLDAALERKTQVRSGVERMFDDKRYAKLIAIACGPAPIPVARISLRLVETSDRCREDRSGGLI